MKDYDVYIFDLDGTLLDSLDDLALSVNYALYQENFPERSIEEIRNFVGNGIRKLIERAVPQGTSEEATERVLVAFKSYYLLHSADNTKPYNGIIEMLKELKSRGKRIAVVSNKFDKATKDLCNCYFGNLIDLAIGESEMISRKPSPDGVNEVLRLLKVKTTECVYIGDSDVDILTANNSGLPCISVTWGYRNRGFLEKHGATLCIDRPMQMLP